MGGSIQSVLPTRHPRLVLDRSFLGRTAGLCAQKTIIRHRCAPILRSIAGLRTKATEQSIAPSKALPVVLNGAALLGSLAGVLTKIEHPTREFQHALQQLQTACSEIFMAARSVLLPFHAEPVGVRFWEQNQYYPIALSMEIGEGPTPLGITVWTKVETSTGPTWERRTVQIFLERCDGRIRCWENVCPHRGASLHNGPTVWIGEKKCRACPYHLHAFGVADGKLMDIPSQRKEFAESSTRRPGLKELHVRVEDGRVLFFNGPMLTADEDSPPVASSYPLEHISILPSSFLSQAREETELRQEELGSAVKTSTATDPTLTQEPKSSGLPQVTQAARTELLAQSYVRQALLRKLRAKQLMRKNARLPNQWYNAALSENVKRQLRVHLLGMDVVLYRDAHGVIACHGFLTGSQSDPVNYDVKEKGGFVWLFYGPAGRTAAERPQIAWIPELDDSSWAVVCSEDTFNCPFKAAIENLIDPAHVQAVHNFGDKVNAEITDTECRTHLTALGGHLTASFSLHNKAANPIWDFFKVDPVVHDVRVFLPGTVAMKFTLGFGLSFITFTSAVPISETRTAIRIAFCRQLLVPAMPFLGDLFNMKVWDNMTRKEVATVLNEDKAVVENVHPELLDREDHVKADFIQSKFWALYTKFIQQAGEDNKDDHSAP